MTVAYQVEPSSASGPTSWCHKGPRGNAEAWAEAAIATARAAEAEPGGGSAFDSILAALPRRLGFTLHVVKQRFAQQQLSNDPADKTRAAGLLAAIAEDAPDALDMLSPDEIVFAAVHQATGSTDQEVKLALAENAAKAVIDGDSAGAAKFGRMLETRDGTATGRLDEAAIQVLDRVVDGEEGVDRLVGGVGDQPSDSNELATELNEYESALDDYFGSFLEAEDDDQSSLPRDDT